MELLEAIVNHLSSEEKGDLRAFLKRSSRSERELRLLDLLIKNPEAKPRAIAGALYQPVNMNAYHSLRKRLLTKVCSFVVTTRINLEADAPDSPLAPIALARFLLERQQPQAALHYLKQAEERALVLRRHDLMESICLLLVDHAQVLGIDAVTVTQKWESNARRYETFRRLKMAQALIYEQFKSVKEKGFPPDPDTIINPVLNNISITAEEANDPAFQLALATIIRRAYASVKEYDRIERFVSRVYRRLEQVGAFAQGDDELKAHFLYMQSHANYRIRAFARCLEQLEALNDILARHPQRFSRIRAKARALEAAVYAYTGHNERSITLLETTLKSGEWDLREKLNMRLNLAVYYFNAAQYRTANRVLHLSAMSDRKLDELMGIEWRFKRGMIALIVQYELGNTEIALSMIKRLQNEFKQHLRTQTYDRAAVFLQFIVRLIQHPEQVHTLEFREEIKTTSMMLTRSSDDIQGIAFFCWIRSKMFKRPYYEVLVERLNEPVDAS